MRYPKPSDRYSCEVLCDNFMEIEKRLNDLAKNSGGSLSDGYGSGATPEQLAQIEQNKNDISQLSGEIADIITELDMVDNPDAISVEPCAVSEPVVTSGGESLISVSDFTMGYYSLFDNGYINANDSNSGYKKAKLENLPAGDYETISLRAIFCVIEDLVTGEKRRVMETDDIFNGTITLQNASNVYLTINSNVDTFYFIGENGTSTDTPENNTNYGNISVSDFVIGYYSINGNGVIYEKNDADGYKKAKLENVPAGDYETVNLRAYFCIIEDLVTGEIRRVMTTDDIYSGIITLDNISNVYLTLSSNVDTFYFRLQGGGSGSTPDVPDIPDVPDTPDNGKVRYSRRLQNIEAHLSDIDIQLESMSVDSSVSPIIDALTGECFTQFIDREQYTSDVRYSLNSNKIVQITTNGYSCIEVQDLKAGKYFYSGFYGAFCFLKNTATNEIEAFTNYNGGNSSITSGTFEVDYDFTLYVTISTQSYNTAMLSSGKLPTTFVYGRYGFQPDSNYYKSEITPVIRVEKDGSGDYSTIKEAIEYAESHPNTKIYIGAGTYDLIEEFGDDYFATLGKVGKSGLKLSNNMHLIFSSNSKVVCNYNGDNANVKTYFAPFNLLDNATGFILENMDLECSNVRYAIHDEANSSLTPYRNYYKNCKMKIDNSQNDAWNPRQCIGGGLGVGEIIIENCYFESTPREATESADIVSYHNGNGAGIQSNIVITGCYFAGNDTCRCSHIGNQTEKSRMMVSNCSMGAEPRVIFESSDFNVENFELIKWNNEIRQS